MTEHIAQALYYYRNKGQKTYKQKLAGALANRKQKAIKAGVPFEITIDDIPLNKVCPILGIVLSHEGGRDNTPSIDRVEPELGYVKGNVRIVSHLANRWKNNMTLEDAKLLISNWNKISA